jgi:transposase
MGVTSGQAVSSQLGSGWYHDNTPPGASHGFGGIGRRANHYLRRQMIHGARAVISRLSKHDDRRSAWLKALVARRGVNRTIVALANKTARIAWVVLTRKEQYAVA